MKLKVLCLKFRICFFFFNLRCFNTLNASIGGNEDVVCYGKLSKVVINTQP